MKFDLNTILIIAVVVLGFLYLRGCNPTTGGDGQEIDLTPDTLYLPGKVDTITIEKKVYITKWMKPDTVKVLISPDGLDTFNVYNTRIEDSLVTGSIISKVKGELISSKLEYTPLFPKYITRVDTFKITKPTPVHKPKWGLYVGGIVGGNSTSFSLEPTVLIKTNKNLQFSAGYGLVNKTYNIGLYTKINNPFR